MDHLRLVVKELQEQSRVKLIDLKVKLRLRGFLEETTILLVYRNDGNRDLEGELILPLDEGTDVKQP